MADERINMPPLCGTHRYLLVHQTGFSRSDPWMALEISAQIALFQACTCDDKVYTKIGGNIKRLPELGCLACEKPDAFGEIVQVASDVDEKGDAIGAIKKLGESWVNAAKKE